MTIPQFWDSTIGEIILYINAYNKQKEQQSKENIISNYNQAYLIASFVGTLFNGETIPSIESLYPSLFSSDQINEEQKKQRDELEMALYKEQMLDFANAYNKKRKAAKEGEQK